MTTFPAFLDTNAIYGGYLCDTLLRLADQKIHGTSSPFREGFADEGPCLETTGWE